MSNPLTPDLAKALLGWFSSAPLVFTELRGANENFRLLDLSNAAVMDHAQRSHWPFLLHKRGWVVPEDALVGDIGQALSLVKKMDEEVAKRPKAKETQKVIDTPPRPAPPADAISWAVCDLDEAQDLIDGHDRRPERQRILKALVDGATRYLPMATDHHVRYVKNLHHRFPNFQPVIDVIARHLRLLELSDCALKLPPILLVGPPGVGKTEFARALADALDMPLRIQSLAETTAGFVLTGCHGTWQEAAPGVIAKHVAGCPDNKAPLILLDELDKARTGGFHRSDLALLGLLEPTTAKAFRDENLDLCIDARPLSFILTANRITDIRPEVLSRLRVIKVNVPTPAQMPAIIRSVDEAIRRESGVLKLHFEPLDQPVIDRLTARPPRDLKRLLLDAYALVAERGIEGARTRLRPEDFDELEGRPQPNEEKAPARFIISLVVDPAGPARVH